MSAVKFTFSFIFLLCALITQTAHAAIATYNLTVTNNWTLDANPINYPSDAHLSWLGGGTHDASQSYWEPGSIATPEFELMAETGVTSDFVNTIAESGGTPLEWKHWFCQPEIVNSNCGSLSVQFTIDSSQPLITLVSMLGPSPDWFVGVSGLSLQEGGNWINNLNVPLALYDAGTENGTIPIMDNSATDPFAPISLIAYDAQTGEYLPSTEEYIVGAFTFELVGVSNVPIPASIWLFVSGLVGLVSFRKRVLQKGQ
ncbi:hypothetical protein MNBD_GAMMA08-3043 [hydrothermal vent metagenome]|uniref:Spondin domain-containing protein n=1 Tax=hydrothermal vent metagenome TaxID=652676 RepID=A0A3B0XJ91_9ZZZZ